MIMEESQERDTAHKTTCTALQGSAGLLNNIKIHTLNWLTPQKFS